MSTALYSYYGDDFTGSTDVLEALATAGVRSVLFLGVPSEKHRRQFDDCQAFGIAGDSRSRSPEWMDAHLPEIFAQLRSFNAPVVHYKTCSTFDSSPRVGSIGRAMEIGRRSLHPTFIPIVVAAPHLRRYVVFGNLFAAAGDQVHRIDGHPTMRQHPVTPMHEADLRRHLAQQTQMSVGLVDLPTLQSGGASLELEAQLAAGAPAVLFDGVGESDLVETGRLIWRSAQGQPLIAIGSSGLTYSLVSAWQAQGVLRTALESDEPGTLVLNRRNAPGPSQPNARGPNQPNTPRPSQPSAPGPSQPNTPGPSQPDAPAQNRPRVAEQPDSASALPNSPERLLVISGSCSPATEQQIKHALSHGYEAVAINPAQLLASALAPSSTADDPIPPATSPACLSPSARGHVERAIAALRDNGKVVVYTSLGPLPRGAAAGGDALGQQLGAMLREIIRASGVRRVVLAGGDTSSHAVAQLGLYALTWMAAIQPGAPLCRAHSDSPELDGLELVLKGGQVGTEDFFERVRTAAPVAPDVPAAASHTPAASHDPAASHAPAASHDPSAPPHAPSGAK